MNSVPVVGIERNFNGIDFNKLEEIFAGGNIKCFYTNSRFHNPLGISLSKNDTKQIVELADKYDVYIIEDDSFGDLALHDRSAPLYYEDMNSRVIYIKSFSKSVLPGLRVAAVVLPKILVNSFASHKKWADLGTSVLSQGALAIYIKCGMIKMHKKRIRNLYEQKMALLKEKVKAADIAHVCWHIPDSGFFACCEILNHADVGNFIRKLYKENIIIHDIRENYLDAYYNDKILKLCMSRATLHDVNDGIAVILDEMAKFKDRTMK
ncbi:MAG: PLP-dependent aminotransferase family protein [Phycisphaerales bacterium]